MVQTTPSLFQYSHNLNVDLCSVKNLIGGNHIESLISYLVFENLGSFLNPVPGDAQEVTHANLTVFLILF